jgi:TolB-like protein/DNA-binding SARP family transcriptional activator
VQRLKLFGGISIDVDGAPVAGRAVQRRRLALLALLAASRATGAAGGISRDKLIALLWPTADAENGRRYLSDSVYRINQALQGEVITTAGDGLRLDLELLPADVADFQDAMARDDPAAAVAVYAGPFLDGFFLPDSVDLERWVEAERSRLASEYARALEMLADHASRRGAATEAAGWLRRLAAHDPYNSRVALRLMRALSDAGERAAAIQHARVHETLLRQELELEPDPQVAALAESLRNDPPAKHPAPTDPIPSVSDIAPPAIAADSAASSALAAVAPPRPTRRARLLVIAGMLALGVAGALAVALRNRPPGASAADLRTIAVLPFANLSADRDNQYFADGMTEELIATLGAVEGLTVASRTSAFAYRDRQLDVRQIARQLGVAAVVEGSVRKSGRSLRLTVQLVDAGNGYRLWSAAFDRQVDDALAIQEEISRAIVARVRGSLIGASAAVAARSTVDPDAYDLYLRGRYAWHQRTRDGLVQAIDFFGKAVAEAPAYARAYAGLGDAYAVSAFYDYLAPADAYPKAEAAARRALALDPTLAAAHATLGYVLTYYQLDWPRAEAEFKRALAIDPAYSTGHQWYANLLTVAGRFPEAEREMRLAQETDPLSLIASAALGWSYYFGERYSAALEQCQRTLALDPDYQLAHLWGGWALDAMGRTSDARDWIGRAVTLSGGSDLTRLALAHVMARSGAADSARALVATLQARAARGEYVPAYEIAKVHLALRDTAQAMRWLERSVHDRSHSRAYLRVDPQLAPLRNAPRFRQLVARTLGQN